MENSCTIRNGKEGRKKEMKDEGEGQMSRRGMQLDSCLNQLVLVILLVGEIANLLFSLAYCHFIILSTLNMEFYCI